MATSIDDNAADENLYKLFGEMSVIQYTSFSISREIRQRKVMTCVYLMPFLH